MGITKKTKVEKYLKKTKSNFKSPQERKSILSTVASTGYRNTEAKILNSELKQVLKASEKKSEKKKIRYFTKCETKLTHNPLKSKHKDVTNVQKVNNSKLINHSRKSSTAALEDSKPSSNLLLEKVRSSVSAMLQLKNASSSSKTVSLFIDEAEPVYMIVQCIRIPKMHNKNFRFCLPHPLVDSSSDICLFVPDLKKGKKIDHEPTIEHYKDILEKNNITEISQVIPVRQMQVEYDQFELRRRLVGQFDMFLVDGRIAGHMLGLLGKEIYIKRKLPVPVDMRSKNLKSTVKVALSKTLLMMHARGNKATLKIGHTKLSVDQISENIMSIAKDLAEHYPGGWNNIRSLYIHVQNSLLIPVYVTLKSSNDVKVPVLKPVIPKKAVPVEGELSTFPGTHVTVLPNGEVIVKKMDRTKEDDEMNLSDSDWEDYNSDNEMDADSVTGEHENKEIKETHFVKKEKQEKVDYSDDETEHVKENSEWTKQWNTDFEGNKKIKKQENMNADSVAREYEDNERSMKNLVKKEKQEGDDYSDDETEDMIETAENVYLNEWTEQWNANIEENNKRIKQMRSDNKVSEELKKKNNNNKKRPAESKKKKQKMAEENFEIKEKRQIGKRRNEETKEEPKKKKQKVTENKRKKQNISEERNEIKESKAVEKAGTKINKRSPKKQNITKKKQKIIEDTSDKRMKKNQKKASSKISNTELNEHFGKKLTKKIESESFEDLGLPHVKLNKKVANEVKLRQKAMEKEKLALKTVSNIKSGQKTIKKKKNKSKRR